MRCFSLSRPNDLSEIRILSASCRKMLQEVIGHRFTQVHGGSLSLADAVRAHRVRDLRENLSVTD